VDTNVLEQDISPMPMATAKPTAVAYVRKAPLPALTGIRTLLALGIVLFHFTPSHLGVLYPLIDNAYVYVGVFFLISGYVLTYNYAERAATLVKRDFWIARVSRLYPVYLLVLVISTTMLFDEWQARPHEEFWRGVVMTPLLLQGWSPTLATFWNTVAWTLSCEVMLYIAFPWLIRAPWPKKPGQLVFLLLGLWAVGLIPHSLYLLVNPDHISGPVTRYSSTELIRFLKFTPLPYACTFLSGVTLGKLQLALPLSSRQRLTLCIASLAALGVFFYGLAPKAAYLLMHGGLAIPLFAALVLGLSGPHFITTCFAWRPLLLVGESSYCLYLLHFNLYQLIHKYHVPERLHVESLDPWFSYVILVLASIAVFKLYETPARRAILRRFPPTPRKLVATPPESLAA
jgi:peptidoglycan/LPS O-acetylase OafA/YrhL